ncbi:MAG: AI-2E family transporter [Candidatus Eremiobacterota bacterium]
MTPTTIRHVVSWLLAALLGWCLYRLVTPFLAPLAWAAVLAIFFHPVYRRLRRRLGKPDVAAFLSTALVTVALIVPALAVLPALVGEASSMVATLPASSVVVKLRGALEALQARLPALLPGLFSPAMLEQALSESTGWLRSTLAQESARLAGNLAKFFFDLGVTIFALFYFFRDGQYLVSLLSHISLIGEERRDRLMREVTEMVQVTVSTTFIVASVQGMLGGLVFWVLGMPSPVLWGVVMGMVSLVPFIGPWLVWGPAGIFLVMDGDYVRGLAMLVLGFLVVSGADNVLRPLLIAGRSQFNLLVVFISVVGGLNAFGLVGVVLGPVLVAAATGFLRALRAEEPDRVEGPAPPASKGAESPKDEVHDGPRADP